MSQPSRTPGPLDALLRWEVSGAPWRVARRTEAGIRVELLTCTGGEVMQVLESADQDLLAYIGTRTASDG